jgi:carbamoyl-phosphate synthase small subunit
MAEKKAILVLEDGMAFEGLSFGAEGTRGGEVVFNTGLTGYQEILTDPSYKGQIVTMTYPLIGNYGVNPEDVESRKPFVEGFCVREYAKLKSNWRATQTLGEYLSQNNIVGIEGIDTRALTRHIREAGAMRGVISTEEFDKKVLQREAQAVPSLIRRDLVKEVSCREAYPSPFNSSSENTLRVVAIDCGIKYNILRLLAQVNCEVILVPPTTTVREILKLEPAGIFLSNGPGDPEGVIYLCEVIKELVTQKPVFGICLGHQLLALSLGAKTYKLKFGHHGCNHPVKNLRTARVEITSQNHGFCVDLASLPSFLEVTHINLYDRTCEGLRHKELPVFSVQYHPEASPGPHDTQYLFEEFRELLEKYA